jgi:hypothetical protein
MSHRHHHEPAQPDAFYSECVKCGHLITCATANSMYRVLSTKHIRVGNGWTMIHRPVWRVSESWRTRIMQPYPWER